MKCRIMEESTGCDNADLENPRRSAGEEVVSGAKIDVEVSPSKKQKRKATSKPEGSKAVKKTKVGDTTTVSTKVKAKKKNVFVKKEGTNVNTDDSVRVSQQVVVVPNKVGVVKKMQTMCSFFKLHEIISFLNEEQKAVVRDIGFGSLLMNQLRDMPLGIGPWLVENFHEATCCQVIGLERYNVTALDVRDAFMLPFYSSKPVKLFPKHSKGPAVQADQIIRTRHKEMFKAKLNKKSDIPLSSVSEYIEKMTSSGDEFKRLFVLCICGYFLAPTSSHIVDMRLVGVIEKVDEIKNLDWSSFVADPLQESREFVTDRESN